MGGTRGDLRRARSAAATADGGLADECARIRKRQAGWLRDEWLLVAAAQKVSGARTRHRAAFPARHRAGARSHGGAPAEAGRRRGAQAPVLRPGAEAGMSGKRGAGSGKRYDAIVVGGGHNGLVCAAYLARAGRKTLVLERRPLVGGAAVTEEIFPGFKFSVFSYVVSLLRPEIIRDLDLPRHGLQILPLESTVTPLDSGDYLAGWADADETRREIARHSPHDAEA